MSIQYPGNEFLRCTLDNEDTCLISETFLGLLNVKEDGVNAYLSMKGRHSNSRCVLFVLKEGKEVVLYNGNDFLLLFLTRR